MHATTAGIADPEVVGREAELDRVHAFLGRGDELPAGLVIEGSAGAGKSTIWRAGVHAARAAGYRVLSCRPAGAEVQLAHAALSDLLEPHLPGILAGLPVPQRRALEVVLLLADEDAAAPDPRAIAAGALNAIRGLAREAPVLLAIDDAQWVDPPSAEVLEFAMRRLGTARVAVLATRRVSSPTASVPSPPTGVRPELALERPTIRFEVGPLSVGAINRILRTRLPIAFNRRTLQRIHDTSGGNPFYALELARALETAADADAAPLPLGGGLQELLAERLMGLPEAAREALFVAAALSQPTVDEIGAAMEVPAEQVVAILAPAVAAQVARLVGDAVEFAHPLLAGAAYVSVDQAGRRAWHARIAGATLDPESGARHLALARPGPDPAVADRLAAAARAARDRGAPTAAAALFVAALGTTPRAPDDDEATRIRLAALLAEAGPILIAYGQAGTTRALIERSIEEIPAGTVRSDLKVLLASLIESDDAGLRGQIRLLDEALEEAGGDPRRTAAALLDREQVERARDNSPAALPLARRAVELAEATGDPLLLARAHVRSADLEVVLGLVRDPVERFARALELGEHVPVDAENSAKSMLAVCLIRAGRLDEARPYLHAERLRATAEGDEASFCWISLFLAELEWFAGNWEVAASVAAEALEVAEQAGLRMRHGGIQAILGLVEASRGEPERARALLESAIATLDALDEAAYGNYAKQMLGFLDLSVGDAEATRRQLPTYPSQRLEGSKRLAFIGDEIEALIRLGDVAGAASLAGALAARGSELGRPPLMATARRSQALVLGAQGRIDEALVAAADAVGQHAALGLPFERARSLLVLGEIQRRAKQRKAARDTLTEAIEELDGLGARLWKARAEGERARIGGRTRIEGLSETELRVAELVAAGRSNKEVAAALFVSVRAVEANLSRVYAKLGIESRTELARRI